MRTASARAKPASTITSPSRSSPSCWSRSSRRYAPNTRPRDHLPYFLHSMKIQNPANGEVIADVPADANADVRRKYQRARAAQPAWAARSVKKRLAAIAAFRERVVAMHDTLAKTLTSEV